MKEKLVKKIGIILIVLGFSITLLPYKTLADEGDFEVDGFNIIPELTEEEIKEGDEAIAEIGSTGGKVMDTYRRIANKASPKKQFARGIMNRNTLMNYLVFVVQFLSQLGLVVGGGFIMYAGYKYMISVFEKGQAPTSTLKNAIIGIIIIIFSYAIMRTFTSIIGLT